ncbi:NAD(P)-dependent oxidoreductase [Janibacter hoylei PVAS-1]|uniref:NAD(P)-dependent oxidoreductase n=1 Tax=Janibacter hoylei PVAS-1 TaxID=1210046 RepID=A0A444B3H3_9MICO|nr:NAD(P)-dependent oxidoreductase [Janibacter hoylei PVAS-1]
MTVATAPIALTGATGRIGGRVADRLATKGVPLRLLVRDPDRAPDLPGATAVVAPFADGEAVREALTGVETAFMVSASEAADRVQQHLTFVEAAAAAGVRHLVYLSFQGASAASTFTFARDHAVTEAAIRGTGLTWTFLRDSFYADFMPGLVGDDGVIRGPGGSGRVAVVAQDDIADAAAAVLLDPAAHAGRTYTLTGPAALSFTEIATIVGEASGREVTYVDETLDEARASRAVYDAPDWEVAGWISTYTAVAAGEHAEVTGDVEALTGHPATPLREVLAAGR